MVNDVIVNLKFDADVLNTIVSGISILVSAGLVIAQIFNTLKVKKLESNLKKKGRIFEDKYAIIRSISLDCRYFFTITEELIDSIYAFSEGIRNCSDDHFNQQFMKLSKYNASFGILIPSSKICLGSKLYNKAEEVRWFLNGIEQDIKTIIENDFNLIVIIDDDKENTVYERNLLANLKNLRKYSQIHLDKLEELFLSELEKK
ncbi:hypothetical protein JEZ13_01965 [bacterium]|nr:hypothetical protein [bacterium]